MRRLAPGSLAVALSIAVIAAAESSWIELKTAHFTVVSNAGDGNTRTIAWQLEQVRSAIAAISPWARVELARPLLVLAVRDEYWMRTLAPKYWEDKRAVHPVSVWVSGADRHYMAIRADLREEERTTEVPINPHLFTYFSYTGLVLQSSVPRELPLWFSRGLSGVLSNTIVRPKTILVGSPIPRHLDLLRQGGRLSVRELIAVTRASPEYRERDRLEIFDAEAWAFVHYLMFADNGVHKDGLNRFANLVLGDKDFESAFQEALGSPQTYDAPFSNYLVRGIYSFAQLNVDVGVKREGFTVRTLPAAEAAAARAAFYVAMGRPIEARKSIDEAHKADPAEPESYTAEGQLLEHEGKRAEAVAAYKSAIDHRSQNAYPYYRSGVLSWRQNPDRETLAALDKQFARAVELNNRYASAYAALAEARSALDANSDTAESLVMRAIGLEPFEPEHHMSAARVLWRLNRRDDARKQAQTAVSLARTPQERDEAQRLLTSIPK